MAVQKIWMVRAGKGGRLFDQFNQEDIVALGLPIGSIEKLTTRNLRINSHPHSFLEYRKS